MRVRSLFGVIVMSVLALSGLSGCATYDDVASRPQCEDSPQVKDLPAQVARRESRCNELNIRFNDDRGGDSKPLDFSGKNKDG